MVSTHLKVFVSSKMAELADERLAIKLALEELKINGWVFEVDAGAQPQTIQQTYRNEISDADLYIGVFWKGYGDYTIEEYQYARELSKDCLIYEKRADIDNQRDGRLQAFLEHIGKVETGHTVRWFSTAAELGEIVKHDVARWQADIVRKYKVSGAPLTYSGPLPADVNNRSELLILINKVKNFWIDGVLNHSLHHEVLHQLGKKNAAEMVENPWETVLELPNRFGSSNVTNKRIAEIFEDAGRSLLILGEPGSGKTTTMLELVNDLIVRAKTTDNQPIPTVFNLSSWSDKGQPLADWLAEELKIKYQVPLKTAREWLEQRRLLLALDGLDEVTPAQRESCVNAINAFIEGYPSGVVVCCRLKEYTDLPVRLKLNAALSLQPLSVEQTDQFLSRSGSELSALREALKQDRYLQELARTPLMLNIMSLAYQNQAVDVLPGAGIDSVDSRRKHLFDVYVERMMKRRGRQHKKFTNGRLKLWLHWLAQQLQRHSHSVFLIEQLQPGWLSTSSLQVRYLLLSRLAAGFLLGVAAGLPIGLAAYISDAHEIKEFLGTTQTNTIETVLLTWLGSSLAGVILGLLTGLVDVITVKLNKKYRIVSELTGAQYNFFSAGMYVILYLALWAFFYLGVTLYEGLRSGDIGIALMGILVLGLSFGIGHWFLLGSRFNWRNGSADIRTVEKLDWTWSNTLRSGVWWAAVTFIVLLPVFLITELNQFIFELRNVLFLSIAFSLVAGALGFLFGGLKPTLVKGKTSPNQGIRMSLRNALLGGAAVGVFPVFISAILLLSLPDRFTGELLMLMVITSLSTAVFFAFRYGAYDVIKHYILRLILCRRGYTPADYVGLLDYAARLVLLQKVGGGYIFMHRLLLEHFAAMETEGESSLS